MIRTIALFFISGILLGLSFILPFGPLLSFIALIPIHYIYFGSLKLYQKFVALYSSLVLGHIIGTIWLYNAFISGPLFLQLINPLFYATILCFGLYITAGFGFYIKALGFILGWILIEYLHFQWELGFVLLHLGNVLGSIPLMIQWIEYTGVLGGTLWILLANMVIYRYFTLKTKSWATASIIILLLPLIFSLWLMKIQKIESLGTKEVVVVHPNMACRGELTHSSDIEKLKKYISLAQSQVSPQTSFLLFPENALREVVFLPYLSTSNPKLMLDSTFKKIQNLNILTGYILYESCNDTYLAKKKGRIYSTHFSNGNPVFCYNTVCRFIPGEVNFTYRSKKKIVPVEETIPYYNVLKNIRKIIPSLGGYFFTYSINDQDVFFTKDKLGFSSLICYESGFGEYCSKLTLEGANLLFVHVNEGWYKNLIGARIFQNMARLRAIESRRYVVRSSNDGISDIISERGEVIHEETAFAPTSFKGNINLYNQKTFYARHGDWIGRWALYGYGILIVVVLIFRLKR